MAKDIELEIWKTIDWYVITKKIRPAGGGSEKYYKNRGLGHGKLMLEDKKLIVGEFTLNYSNILKVEKNRKIPYYILISSTDGITYWFTCFPGRSKRTKLLNPVISIIKEKLKEFEKIKNSEAIEFIKDLPNLYNEILFDDITLRTGLERADIMKIIEDLIQNGDIRAEISGNTLKLKRESDVITSPKGYETNISEIQEFERKEGLLIFVSYATKDAELYKIPELAHKLESYKEIGEVLYWQEDMHDSIIEYMNINLGRCDVVLLFCSPNALDSIPVNKEWMAAEALKKPIIPIFVKSEHIPPLLSDRLGFEFDTFDFQKNVQEMYELILKKKES